MSIIRFKDNYSLNHSSGPWKDHKYVRKDGDRYVYEDTKVKIDATIPTRIKGRSPSDTKPKIEVETNKEKPSINLDRFKESLAEVGEYLLEKCEDLAMDVPENIDMIAKDVRKKIREMDRKIKSFSKKEN